MARMTWTESIRSLGGEIIGLMWAEVRLVVAEFKPWLGGVARLFGVVAAVLVFALYLPFLVLLATVDAFRTGLGWPIWGSALTVLGILMLLMGLAVWLAWYRWGRHLDSPGAIVQRRIDEHNGWWHQRVFAKQQPMPDGEAVEEI